jgi:hypothetical protein
VAARYVIQRFRSSGTRYVFANSWVFQRRGASVVVLVVLIVSFEARTGWPAASLGTHLSHQLWQGDEQSGNDHVEWGG